LVIDDSADFLRYVCDYLDSLSNVDVSATGRSGHDAIVLAHEWVPDLVPTENSSPAGSVPGR